jgi:drug/metabolite transporter (DMT)-like permease
MTGFLGIALLLGQGVHLGVLPQGAILASVGLLTAAFAWALGSVLLTRISFTAPSLVCTCWQMLIGGVVDMLIGVGAGGYRSSSWSLEAWLALIFLAIGGTLLGFTSYSFLLRRVSLTSVATYAYINPLVAILLGWLLLDEPLMASQWLGLVIVLGSVAVVVSFPARASQVSARTSTRVPSL